MNNKMYLLTWFLVLFLVTPNISLAYNLGIDVNKYGYVIYSYPSVLGEENKEDEDKEEEYREEKKFEIKEISKVEKPEKIEIKKVENKTRVEFKKQEKVEQKMNPEKVNLKFSSVPKTTPIHKSEVEDVNENEVDDTDEIIKERIDRKNEKVEIQSEVHDDDTVEIQIESRKIKAKIKNSGIELDIKNNNIGSTDINGNRIELVHLPDQAMQKFIDLGVLMTPDTLEVGQSGETFKYTVDAVKIKKIFGLIPREVKFKLSLNDNTGTVEQKEFANNLVEQILNLFSF